MWKWCAGLALAVGLGMALPQAASAQIVTFDFAGLAGSEVSATNNAKDANLANTVITRSASLYAAANGDRFNATNWAVASIANAVASNRYMQFTITPNSGYQFAVTSIVVKWQRSATGNSAVSLRSSADSYASDIGSVWTITDNTSTQTNTWTLSQANSTAGVTYRLYSYAEAAGGTGGPGDGAGNDISIYGSVTAAVTEPTTHASSLSFSAVGSSGMTASWTSGDGANRIVVVREGAATSWTPTDGVAPSGVNADFSAATDQGSGNKICYDGSGATFGLSGLSAGTTYYVTVFEYNGSGGTVNYYTGGTPLAGSQATAAATGIWINPMSAGTPMGSYYLGDTLGDWYVNFEIGQASWDYAQVGLGTSLAGADYNWGVANWYEDGEGSNKRVRRNLSGTQFTAAGSYYVICQARANSGDAYTSKSGNGWDNKTAYPPADLASAYFTVNGLTAASDVSAAKDATYPATRVDLGWTRWNDRNVLITVATATPSGSPVNGTTYSASDTFGNQTVVSGSQAGTALEVTGLVPGQTYYFTFYSENFSYYSAGATASAVTMDRPQAKNSGAEGVPQAPAAIFLGDSDLTFGLDSWGQIEANYGAARLWLRYNNADLTGGTASDWSDFVNTENKTRASGVFNQIGTWYWGLQMDYGAEYGTAFWYKAASADWADLSATGSGASLTVTVSAINDAGSQTATRSTVNPTSEIDLTWAKNAQDKNVMVVRKLAADSWTEPTQGQAYAAADTLGAGTVVYNGSATAASATGLTEDSTYDFKFYAVNNDYYSAGVTAQASTKGCAPDAPTGLDADPNFTDFTASWDAVTDATGYRIDVSPEADFSVPGAGASIYTADWEDSSKGGYTTGVITNNGVVWTFNEAMVGTLAGDRKNGSRSARIRSNETVNSSGIISMNSDTNMGLSSITLLYAIYGTDGSSAGRVEYSTTGGSSWISAGTFTASSTTLTLFTATNLNVTGNVRVRVVKTSGTTERLNIDDIKLYPYSPDVPAFVAGYENLAVAGTSVAVTGLDELTTYYFRVRAEGEGGCPSANSTTASTATRESPKPQLSKTSVNVRENGEGRFFVRLTNAPASVVTVTVSRVSGSTDLSVKAADPVKFTPSSWSSWRVLTLEAADDANTGDETATFRVSATGLGDVNVTATALDDDLGENIALAANGATMRKINAILPTNLIDGVHTSSLNYGYTIWTNVPPGTMTLELRNTASVSRVQLLNFDWNYRTHQYTLEHSMNGTDWTLFADASTGAHSGWEKWDLTHQQMRFLRLTGLSNTVNRSVCIAELEIYGNVGAPPQDQTIDFPPIADQATTATVNLSATASSGLPVSFAVLRGPGSISGGTTLTFTGAGEVTIVASQAGDNNWNPAPDVTNTFYAESAVPAFNATSVNVREEGEGRLYLRLSQAPEANVTVRIARGSGDESLSVKSGDTLVFTPANWNAWRIVTLQAAADENGDDEQAVFQVTMAGARARTVTATALDIDIGKNLSLSSAGATITTTNAIAASNLIDGVHMSSTNYGYTVWTNVPPGTMNLDLHTTALVSRVRVLNFDWNFRTHQYTIESSSNGVDWAMVADASEDQHSGWEDWAVADVPVRYLRFTGLSNTANRAVCVAELEVYSAAAALQQDQTIDFPQIPDQQTTNELVLSATASSGLPVSFRVASGPAVLNGATLTFTGVGVVTVVASQPGNASWKPAPEVANSFWVEQTAPFFRTEGANVREGGEGRFFMRLSQAPTSTVVTKITFASGDAGISVKSGATQTFTPANWSVWRIVTFQAAEDANSDDETATFQVAMPGIRPRSLVVTALDDEVGENLALASAGATITWTNAVLVTNMIDGVHMSSLNYGYTKWTNDPPGYMVLDLGSVGLVTHVRVLNFDWNYRVHQYRIESSMDGDEWTQVADASTGDHSGWENYVSAGTSMRYVRFTGLSNSANHAVCVAELEVYGTRVPGRRSVDAVSDLILTRPSEPVAVVTSDDDAPDYETGWAAVDGDPATAWVGQKAGGGYILVGYEPVLRLKALEVDMAEGSLTGIEYRYSQDGEEWLPLPEDIEANPVYLNFLWLVFPDDGTAAVPAVYEIRPNP